MRQALFLIIGLLLLSGLSLGQVSTKPDSVRMRRYERGGSGFDEITEANYELTRRIDTSNDLAVVRICSRESMPLALSIATMNPFTVARALNQGYNFSLERILFLRSEDCLGSDPAVAYWYGPGDPNNAKNAAKNRANYRDEAMSRYGKYQEFFNCLPH